MYNNLSTFCNVEQFYEKRKRNFMRKIGYQTVGWMLLYK